MNSFPPVLRRLWLPLFCVLFSTPLFAADCKVMLLSGSTMFPGSGIATQLQSMLAGSGSFTTVNVTWRDLYRDFGYSTSLLGAAYVPPSRTDHLAAIQQGGWTHVVMVDRPFNYAVAPELHYIGVNAMAKTISAAGAQPLLMMPWVDRANIEGYATNNALVREYAYRVGDGARDSGGNAVPVIPAGVAWSSLNATHRGTVPAQPTTGVALNVNAQYAAAAAIFTYLTGQNAKDTGYLPAGLTSTTRDAIADHVVSTAANEAVATRYSGEFQSARIQFWNGTTQIAYSADGTSTENAIRDQLADICAADAMPSANTYRVYVNNVTAGKTPSNLVFGRYYNDYVTSGTTYDSGIPMTTMVAGFDRQYDEVSNGPEAAIYAEIETINLYKLGISKGWAFLPYHLLWVRTMYDLNIPIDEFNVHATDWQFAATASALYTQRSGGRNGIHPAVAGKAQWSPAERTRRFSWQTGLMAWRNTFEMGTLKPAPAVASRPYGMDRVIDAEYFLQSSGPMTVTPHAVETFQVQGVGEGEWMSYKVDLGTTAPTVISCIVSAASVSAGAQIEVRHGSSTGTLLGTLNVPATGGATTFQEVRGLLTPAGLAGGQDIVLVCKAPGGQEIALDWIRFSLLAVADESVWVTSGSGLWSSAANWFPNVPDAAGWKARFSLDIPGGYGAATGVTISGTRTLGGLVLGHGAGTTGGIVLQGDGESALNFDNGAATAVIQKTAGGKDVIAVPIRSSGTLQANNRTASALVFQAPIAGRPDFLPFGNVQFSGEHHDLGRVGYSRGYSQPNYTEPNSQFSTFLWNASGTMHNFNIPLFTSWTMQGGDWTNLGWTELGNDDVGGSGSSTFTLNSGTFRHASTNLLRMGQRVSADSFVNLNGGVFETQTFFTKTTYADATFTFNGGLLRYTGTSDVADLFATGTNAAIVTRVGVNGARLEVAEGRTVTLKNRLLSVTGTDAGLEKTGGGTLVLSGSNTFTGPVVVKSGTLRATGPTSLGFAGKFTVNRGARLSIPGPGSITITGSTPGWVGGGVLDGELLIYSSGFNLEEGPLQITGALYAQDVTLRFVPEQGETVVQAGANVAFGGGLTLDMLAPAQAIPAGGTVTLFAANERFDQFNSVAGGSLWTPSYTATGLILTANVNIPGVALSEPNHGESATWGDTVVLSATASDVVGVAKVEFFANGLKIGEGVPGARGVYILEWLTGNVESGSYAITTRVTNSAGLVLESSAQTLVVSGISGATATWINPAGGAWSTGENWSGGFIADALASTRFDAQDLPAGTTTVNLDAPRTVSKIFVGDTVTATSGTLKIAGTSALVISGGAGEVSVGAGSSGELEVPVAAPAGFTKTGGGILRLSSSNAGLAGKTRVAAGSLIVGSSGALGSSALHLTGGSVSFPTSLTLPNAFHLDSGTAAITASVSSPVTFTGTFGNAVGTSGARFILMATATSGSMTLANSVNIPGMDLQLAGFDSAINVTGTLAAQKFTFYGRTGSPNRAITLIFSGSASAVCTEKMATINDSCTATIRINDQAQITAPDFTVSARTNFVLNGGMLTARRVPVATLGSFAFNGGTLRAMASDPQFVTFTAGSANNVRVQTGGMIVDTNGFDVGVNPLVATNTNPDGGLTKKGGGTLTLTGSAVGMTWRGATTIQSGTLKLGALSGLSTNSKVFNIGTGAALDIASSMTPTLLLSSTLHFLTASGSLRGDLSMTAGKVTLTAGQPLTVSGTIGLSGAGPRTLDITGTLNGPGDYVVLAGASLSGTFTSVLPLPVAPAGFTRSLVYDASRVLLRVSGPGETWLAANAAPGTPFSTDSDANGWSLLQEYALGAVPGEDVAGKVSGGLSGNGKPEVHFGYNTAATDVTMYVESSPDLTTWTALFSKAAGQTTTWTPLVAGAEMVNGSLSGGIQQVVVTSPDALGARTFFRIRLQRAQ